jgi:DNA-binding MarR family transcriptional regulator
MLFYVHTHLLQLGAYAYIVKKVAIDGAAAMEKEARCNVTALRQATRNISQFYDSVLAESGLRSTQRAILARISRQDRAPTMSELASGLVLDRTALNHNLKPLERDGLVAILTDPDDRRSKRIKLTRRGEAKLAESESAWKRAQERFETAFGAKEAAALRSTLALVASLDLSEAKAG